LEEIVIFWSILEPSRKLFGPFLNFLEKCGVPPQRLVKPERAHVLSVLTSVGLSASWRAMTVQKPIDDGSSRSSLRRPEMAGANG
jgi:hypothetical protein